MTSVKRIGVLLVLWGSCLGMLQAQNQLREQVVLVRPSYTEAMEKAIRLFAKEDFEYGYKDDSQAALKWLDGEWCAGFLYRMPDGKKVVLTHRWSAPQTDQVDVKTVSMTGDTVVYAACPVVRSDEECELLMVSLPDLFPVEPAIVLANRMADEGDDIYVGGYSASDARLVWQFTDGVVSNLSDSLYSLLGAYKTSYAHHTAPVDRNFTGAPVLVERDGKYQAVGLIVDKISYLENRSLFLPLDYLRDLVEHEPSDRDFEDALGHFNYCLQTDKLEMVAHMLSHTIIQNVKYVDYLTLARRGSARMGLRVTSCTKLGLTADAARMAFADMIMHWYRAFGVHELAREQSGDTITQRLLWDKKSDMQLRWSRQRDGQWRINAVHKIKHVK